jgi:SAM-dependent methyltransferase
MDGKVLDIGANDGFFLSKVDASTKVGVDLWVDAVDEVPILISDACRLPFASSTFRNVFVFDILEHVEHDQLVTNEAIRVLNSKGTLWGSVPSSDYSVDWIRALDRRYQLAWGHVRRGYSVSELQALFPGVADVAVYRWNEPVFRSFYSLFKALSLVSAVLTQYFVSLIARIDARWSEGNAGHLFFRVVKNW